MDSKNDCGHYSRGHTTPHSGPRTVIIPRTECGFGFTLRHFIVYPPEPKDCLKDRECCSDNETEELYFQKINQGNLEPLDTIFVKNVKEGGPAYKAGLNSGDRIIAVNREPVTGKSYSQVINLIQHTTSELSLLVVPKEEDILQLAYHNSSQSYETEYDGQMLRVSPYPNYHSEHSMDNKAHHITSSKDRKNLSTSSLDTNLYGNTDSYPRVEREPTRCGLKTSTSYTSGLSIYHEPSHKEENMNKEVFLDRRREFENRAVQENVNPNSLKAYSFGLYFPKKEVSSVDNLARPVVMRRSRENVLQSADSQENISKVQSSRIRNIPVEYRHSGTYEHIERYVSQDNLFDNDTRSHGQYGKESSVRHSFPDSGVQIWTSPTRRLSDAKNQYGFEHGTPQPENSSNNRETYTSSRQYVPVINESSISKSPKMSASVDSIDPRSNLYRTEHHLRTAYNTTTSSEQQNQNYTSPKRIILKFGDGQERSATPNMTQSTMAQTPNHSYGAAFALTKSPTSAEMEIKQKREARILVSHRKKQFEDRREVSPPPSNSSNPSRYKTEIEKMSVTKKYDGIQSRLATFENKTTLVEQQLRSRSQTPQSAQPVNKVRRMSQERMRSPEPMQNKNTQYAQGSSLSNFSDSAPIRIYVSQGISNTSGPPIVEIVPMQSSELLSELRGQGQYGTQTDSSRDQSDSPESQKPVRKASFLSAVNAPYSRYLSPSGYDNETPAAEVSSKSSRSYSSNQSLSSQDLRDGSTTPTNFQWVERSPTPDRALSPMDLVSSSSNVSITSSTVSLAQNSMIRLRKKPEITAEDYETKMHRRTSYLMATSKDRAAVTLTMSPPSANIPLDLNTPATLSKHKSMRKIKDFFGEKTPKILEATERKLTDPSPASPIQQVIKDGTLLVKVDMIDGKRASDRSWRQVWAVLRGHAFYLFKERKDPTNFVAHALSIKVRAGNSQQTNIFYYEEQPISVKACIVDIAHNYTKKKNVFRMKTYNGSEYLFQAEDHEQMMSWITKIKINCNPDADDHGVTNAELIIRKSHEMVESSAPPLVKASPPTSQKMQKKLSVLSMKQKMTHSPSLKRRKTNLGEKPDKDDSGKSKTWKGKLGKSFKKQFGSSPPSRIPSVPETSGMFGIPLEDCVPSPNNEFVPLIVDLCTRIVEAKGLEMIGVYRIPGNKAAVTLLQEEFNKGIGAMNLEHEKWSDVNVISSLLKSFFRQLPEPIIPDELYQPFIDASRLEDSEKRMLKLKRLIHELPDHHFETFKHLAKHLNKVAMYADVNRMEAKNLAIVFGPTLVRRSDDSMVALFTDMSDHCKIIESIILHCDWFFGDWAMDNHVPTDDDATECTSLTSGHTSSTRDDAEGINPKEIVSSIVEAANRKMRGETVEKQIVPEPLVVFNERNIDQEILLRSRKIDTSITSKSSPNLAAMHRAADMLKTSVPDLVSDRRMAKSQEICDREFVDFDFIDAEKENSNAYLSPTTRYFLEDSLMDKNDEMELSHGSQNGNYRWSRETIDSLRRIEMEARALREREERRQRDLEKRQVERQRIEQDILKTEQELEIEDRHSIEDLLNAPSYSKFGVNVDYSNKCRTESSVYRNSSSNSSGSERGKYGTDSPTGGKYFVIKGNTQQVGLKRSSKPPRQTSVDSLVAQSKRTGSLENMSENQHQSKGHGRPLTRVHVRKGDEQSKRDSKEIKRRSGGIARSNSMRRGSLDSLIDLIEKRDSRMSWASTDSDEGLDLLTTLTSTFDKKLQNLSLVKSMQPIVTAPLPPKRSPYNTSSSSLNTTASQADLGDSLVQSAQHRLPPQVPLSMITRPNSAADLPSKQYRDPSLHRTPPKSDTKIGLATRFERSTTHNPINEVHSDSHLNMLSRNGNNYGMNLHSDMTYSVDYINNNSSSRVTERSEEDSRVSSVMVVISSPSVMSADSHQSGNYALPQYYAKPMMSSATNQSKWEGYSPQSANRMEYRPISKSEKTELNVKLSQDKNKGIVTSVSFNKEAKSRSASPQPTFQKQGEKRKKRRHTVGGTSDSEHMRAIDETSTKDEPRLSAWEQLQPVVSSNSNIGPNSSMLTWLRNERLRGSSPNLSDTRKDTNIAKRH